MTVHDKLYRMAGLANELAHEWEAEGNTAQGMLASELIEKLIPIRDNHGDPLVTIYAHQWYQHVGSVRPPGDGQFAAVLWLGDELDPREG